MASQFNAQEQRVLRFLEKALVEGHREPHVLTEPATSPAKVKAACGIDEPTYRRIIIRLESLGIAEAVIPRATDEWIRVHTKIVEVVRDIDDQLAHPAESQLPVQGPPIFQVDGIKTLPIYVMMGQAQENITRFGKGDVRVEAVDPDYPDFTYDVSPRWLDAIGKDAGLASRIVMDWIRHLMVFTYFVQLRDDADRRRIASLSSHTELVSILCDARLAIDPSELWATFDEVYGFEIIHTEYRADPDREARYSAYAQRLDATWNRLSDKNRSASRLIERIIRQINLKSGQWDKMPPLSTSPAAGPSPAGVTPLKLFYSYSHKDEVLRDQVETHLSLLKRQGVIAEWHDRRITAGTEWKGEIDENLKSSQVILLLVSADFIASDYCYDVEMKRALEKHEAGTARVIPVILRACDWHGAPFGRLKALPEDGKPITSWTNGDEAFTDVAKGIRKVTEELRKF